PEYFQKEKEKIFKRAWINIGRVDAHIPKPGDYMVREMDFLNAPVLMVHGRDGVIRTFYNVCTHRGNSVASGSGNARSAFVCGFHGWAFGLDGSLKTVPSEEQFPGLDRSQYGLKTITTEVWNGFIFINVQDKPATPLVEFLGGWGEQMKGISYENYEHTGRYTAHVKCNWKVYVDAFQEAYHVGLVHAESLAQLAMHPDMSVPTSMRTYGPHRSISTWMHPQYKPSPVEAIAWKYGASLVNPVGSTEASSAINPSKDENWWFDINVCFPNFFVDVGTGWYFTYNFFPVSEHETFWEVNIYQLHASTPSQQIAQSQMNSALRDVLYEDLSTMEGVQQGLNSGAIKTILPGECEATIRHQYWAVEQWVNAK
ncbi:MAG: aromatic ring-hydroxylating dioxygenase subunit alpha, partial [Rugosibacter sp.]